MKKVCVFLMFILSVYGIFPAYATTDIAADAESSECTENVTGTYSGDANFKAKWRSNVIQLNWYNNNTLMQGVNTESNTCNYGGALTIPTTPPERAGYIFDGWKVRPKMDFSTLTSLEKGSERWAKDASTRCFHDIGNGGGAIACKDSGFSDLKDKEWKIKFGSGMLYGSAYCSARPGDNSNGTFPVDDSINWLATYDELESATGDKRYCWCQATGWKPNTNNPDDTIYGPSSAVCVLFRAYSSSAGCNFECASRCAYNTLHYILYRQSLVNPTGN